MVQLICDVTHLLENENHIMLILLWVIMQGSHRSLKTWKVLELENLDSKPVEVLQSPGIWTYRSIFLIISIQEFSHYTSFNIWVYFLRVKSSLIH